MTIMFYHFLAPGCGFLTLEGNCTKSYQDTRSFYLKEHLYTKSTKNSDILFKELQKIYFHLIDIICFLFDLKLNTY